MSLKETMSVKAGDHFQTILDLSDRLVAVSESGFYTFDDDGCLLLNGIVRDCAFRLRNAVELERRAHMTKDIVNAGQEVKRCTENDRRVCVRIPNTGHERRKETHHEGA